MSTSLHQPPRPTSITDPSDHDFDSLTPSPSTLTEILVLVTVFGWLLFGIISILCINGRGRAGRWVPEWYLDSNGTKRDRAAVVGWWATVVLFWPVIWPVVVVRKLGGCLGKAWRTVRGRMERIGEDGEERVWKEGRPEVSAA